MAFKDPEFRSCLTLALAVGLTAVTMLGAVDQLRDQVAVSLKTLDRGSSGIDLIVDGAPSDSLEGVRLALLLLNLGGVVLTVVGFALSVRSQRLSVIPSAQWAQLLHASLIFQLCALSAAIFLCLLFTLVLSEFEGHLFAAGLVGLVLLANVGCNVVGVQSWRKLLSAAS